MGYIIVFNDVPNTQTFVDCVCIRHRTSINPIPTNAFPFYICKMLLSAVPTWHHSYRSISNSTCYVRLVSLVWDSKYDELVTSIKRKQLESAFVAVALGDLLPANESVGATLFELGEHDVGMIKRRNDQRVGLQCKYFELIIARSDWTGINFIGFDVNKTYFKLQKNLFSLMGNIKASFCFNSKSISNKYLKLQQNLFSLLFDLVQSEKWAKTWKVLQKKRIFINYNVSYIRWWNLDRWNNKFLVKFEQKIF